MKFVDIDDDHEGDWQTNEIQKLTAKVEEMARENADLRRKLDEKAYTETYKENQRLQLQLKNMFILMEENKDLREELETFQNAT